MPDPATLQHLGAETGAAACSRIAADRRRRQRSAAERALPSSSIIDRATAARFGITPATVDNALYDAFGQRIISTIFTQSNQYRVILEVDPTLQRSLDWPEFASTCRRRPSTTRPGAAVGHRANIEQHGAAADHALRPVPGDDDLVQYRAGRLARRGGRRDQAAEKEIGLPVSFTVSFQGAAQAFQSALSQRGVPDRSPRSSTMYIVLGVLYESFIHPITILSTLPSAGVGALAVAECRRRSTSTSSASSASCC